MMRAATLILMVLTAPTAWAADITVNNALVINSSNKSTYNGKSIGGTIPGNSSAGTSTDFYSDAGIVVDGIELNLTIDGLNTDYSERYRLISGIALRNGATLHLTVSGTNTLKAGFGGAGIAVPDGCTLEITSSSTGTLNAIGGTNYGGGAGIGSIGDGASTNTEKRYMTPQGLGDIIINGGTVNAQGGTWYDNHSPVGGAAGIGSSELSGAGSASSGQTYSDNRYIDNITGTVTINGGTVNATGGAKAAGIGGGDLGTLKTITMTGGTVNASAGLFAAAVGCGYHQGQTGLVCPVISITNGNLTANGNIGYGSSPDNDNLYSGGTVTIGQDVTLKCTGTIRPFEAATIPSNSYVGSDGCLKQAQNVSSVFGKDELTEGWWVVDKYTETSNRIIITGTVNLILNDDVTLKADAGIHVYKGNTLNIYTQMNGTGKIIAKGYSDNSGIGGGDVDKVTSYSQWDRSCGTINIYGGTVEATGGSCGAGIGSGPIHKETTDGGTINIYGGNVKATGGYNGAGIGSGVIFFDDVFTNPQKVNIYGGTVVASGDYNGAGIGGGYQAPGGSISIKGGNVTATSIGKGYHGSDGTIELDWTNVTDCIYASSYRGNVTLTKTFMLKGSTTEATTGNIGGQTIVPPVAVSFNANGGSGTMDAVNVAYGGQYSLPECTFTPEVGMVFDKWLVGDDKFEVGGSFDVTAETEVKALWKYGSRTATFDANGHGTAPVAQTVDYGAKLTEPSALTEEGWTFGGWYRENSCVNRWEFASETLTENVTLYAKWTQNSYTISYELDGGINSKNNPLSYMTTETFSLTAPTKLGYTFEGWTYDDQSTPVKDVTITGGTSNRTFTAHWTLNQYTITFDTDGATEVDPVTYYYDADVTDPGVFPTCKGRIFDRWDNLPSKMPAEDITIHAKWKWLYHYEAREATCSDEGMIECYYSNGNYYSENFNGETYTYTLISESVFTPKTGHDYDNPEWTWLIHNYSGEWIAKLKLTCKKDPSHVTQTFTTKDEVTSEVTTEPTETTEGVLTYTATIVVNENSDKNIEERTFTDTHEVAIPKTAVIAKIGETGYPSVNAAMAKASSGDVVKVMEDVNEPENSCSSNNAITLDLNGHDVTLNSINMNASLTVKNGTLRCVINNQNIGNEHTLTLDHAEVYCEEYKRYVEIDQQWVSEMGLQWLATNINVTNGSMFHISGRTSLGSGGEDGFNLVIDGTSCVLLTEAVLCSYNVTRVGSQFAQYLPEGFTISYDYNNEQCKVMQGDNEYTSLVTLSPSTITLADNSDNSAIIAYTAGYRKNVTLQGRTLYKDGAWNTLCLPFALSAEQIAANPDFAGATLMTIDVTEKNGFDATDGILYLWFKTATEIEAGVPYLVKWTSGDNITGPVFQGVTISNSTAQTLASETAGLETVQMVGTYSPVGVTANDKSILFLGDANTLYYSSTDRQIRSCHAYFSVPYIKGHPETKARAFALNFDGEETTGILEVSAKSNEVKDDVWYSLDGVRLSGKPTQRGMYINKGKKILVK